MATVSLLLIFLLALLTLDLHPPHSSEDLIMLSVIETDLMMTDTYYFNYMRHNPRLVLFNYLSSPSMGHSTALSQDLSRETSQSSTVRGNLASTSILKCAHMYLPNLSTSENNIAKV